MHGVLYGFSYLFKGYSLFEHADDIFQCTAWGIYDFSSFLYFIIWHLLKSIIQSSRHIKGFSIFIKGVCIVSFNYDRYGRIGYVTIHFCTQVNFNNISIAQ